MRKWLVKNFVLDYMVSIFGKKYNAPRASRIIYPVFVITGIANVFNDNWPTPTLFVWFMYLLTATSLFFGFVYFRFFPVKWGELDEFQKFQYGHFPYANLTTKQYQEWITIREKYNK
jgi:hypothetical protein